MKKLFLTVCGLMAVLAATPARAQGYEGLIPADTPDTPLYTMPAAKAPDTIYGAPDTPADIYSFVDATDTSKTPQQKRLDAIRAAQAARGLPAADGTVPRDDVAEQIRQKQREEVQRKVNEHMEKLRALKKEQSK